MGLWVSLGFNNPNNPLDFTEAQRQTHRPQSPGLKRSQWRHPQRASCELQADWTYVISTYINPGVFFSCSREHPYELLLSGRQEIWLDSVPQKAWTQPRKVKKHTHTSEHLENCCTSPGSFCFLIKLLTSSLQQNVHSWNGVLNIWILTCWWIHSRASGHNPPCGDIELKSLQCAKTRWLKNMQQRRT